MLMAVLVFLLLGVSVLIVVRRRAIGRLSSLATLLAALIAMIWMQNHGLLPGSQPPAAPDAPVALGR